MGLFEKIALAAALAAAILVPTLHSQIDKSKATSADSCAKEMITTVNSWIAEDIAAGGEDKSPCELRITMINGDVSITDNTRKNDWEARKGCPEGLVQRFGSDYPNRTFTATVFVDNSGYAVYSWFVPDDANYRGDAPSLADFEAFCYDGWKSDKEGMTKDGVVIGTYPKLMSKSDER